VQTTVVVVNSNGDTTTVTTPDTQAPLVVLDVVINISDSNIIARAEDVLARFTETR